jgi:hypothetical protein
LFSPKKDEAKASDERETIAPEAFVVEKKQKFNFFSDTQAIKVRKWFPLRVLEVNFN